MGRLDSTSSPVRDVLGSLLMHRWSLFVFALCGLCLGCAARGAAPPAPSAAADPFADCEWADPKDNMLICGAVFVAFMPQTTPATSFQVLFDSAVAGIESSSGEEVHATPATLDSFPAGSSLMYLGSQGGSLEGMAFMGPPTDPSSAFFSLCLGKSESDPKSRCEAMLVAAIAGDMPKRLAPPGPPPDAMVGPLEAADLPFIIKTIIGSNKSIKRCITSQKTRDPDLSGKIYVKFKIAPSGLVSRARVTTSRYAGTPLDTCISREVNALRFPPFEGKTQNITYPLLVIAD